MKIALSILTLIAVTLLAVLVGGHFSARARFDREVQALFASAREVSAPKFSFEEVKNLPAPVRRYFRFVLPEGRPRISTARLRHGGEFRTAPDKKWMEIRGEEYFTAEPPGLAWRGFLPFASGMDSYVNGRGRFAIYLLSAVRLFDLQGEKVNQGELLRWLVEGVWFPTALLPRENLKWSPLDDRSALLEFSHQGINLSVRTFFSEKGEITRFETKRYMNDTLENWVGQCAEYREFAGVRIPTRVEVSWQLAAGEFSYARFIITEIEFDRPEKFPD